MKLPTRPPKSPFQLSDSTLRNLDMYALAAGAAGVSLAALAQPAEAKIVYTAVHENAVGVNLDLNNDGTSDFRICLSTDTYHCTHTTGMRVRPDPEVYWDALEVKPLNAANAVLVSTKGQFASALPSGKQIGIKGKFGKNDYWMAGEDCSSTCSNVGPWFNVNSRYLGFKFAIDHKIHYGWARLNVHWLTKKAILTGYAYETIPNKPIIAGKTKGPDVITLEPGSLGRLARGSAGRLGK